MADHGRAILLDANLLVLWIVGNFDRSLVGQRRLDEYTPSDFDLLGELIAGYPRKLTTPHLLTECNNIADKCVPKLYQEDFREFFQAFTGGLDERWMPATGLMATGEFKLLGLADAAVCELSGGSTRVLSVDAQLCNSLWERGADAENFNHLRKK